MKKQRCCINNNLNISLKNGIVDFIVSKHIYNDYVIAAKLKFINFSITDSTVQRIVEDPKFVSKIHKDKCR